MSAAAELEAIADNVERFPHQAVRRAVTDLRPAILSQARIDTGGDLRLSGDRQTRQQLTVAVDVTGLTVVTGTIEPGPRRLLTRWRWLNDGTRPRAQGRGRHPGTPAKNTIDRPVARALPRIERDIAAEFEQVIQR